MNKWLNISLLILLVASACSKVEVATSSGGQVSFRVGSYALQTRAEGDPVPLGNVGIDAFFSRGYLHAVGLMDEPQDFLGATGETITYNGTDAWLPSHDYFWPKSPVSYVNFVSWYGVPTTPNPVTYSKVDGQWTAGFNLTDVTVDPSSDILLADVAWRYNANVNPATYNQYNGVAQGVPTLFHHLLSQVCFVGALTKNSDTKVTWEVKVTSISLAGASGQGSISLTNVDPGQNKTQAWSDIAWTNPSGNAAISAQNKTITALAGSAAPDTLIRWSSVLPQSVTNDMVLTLNYEVTTKYGDTPSSPVRTVIEPVTRSVRLSDFSAAVSEWGIGQRITYSIKIDPDTKAITVIPEETDWIDQPWYNLPVE